MTSGSSVPAMVATAVQRFGPRECVVDGELRLTFADLGERVREAAKAVVAAGIEHGDRVAIWAPNRWEWIVAALGVHTAGGVLVPVNTRFKGREAGYVLEKAGVRLLFTVGEFLGTDYVQELRDHYGGPEDGRPVDGIERLEAIVVLEDGEVPAATVPWSVFLERAHDVGDEEADARAAAIDPDDLSDVIFTSGTTGRPKGVMATHGQTLRVFETWSEIVGLREGDRYLVINPFFHTFGYKAGFLSAIMRGAVTMPLAAFDVDAALERIEAERVTVLPGPPTLYQSILEHTGRSGRDLSSLRLAVTGAAVVPVELIRQMRSELGFETVLTAYGLTEATGVVTMCRPGDDPETIANTSGRAIPDVEVRVDAPPREPGEIMVRGYNVTQGYFEDPEATAEAIDPDGWLHTGDIGVMDPDGNVRITDRLKDMFIVGGFNAYPAEIEGELLEHPSVAQAAVVGMPDERLGEVACAFVVPRHGRTVDPDGLMAWARERMANYKVPRRVEVVESLPLNPSGKVLKFELRERMR